MSRNGYAPQKQTNHMSALACSPSPYHPLIRVGHMCIRVVVLNQVASDMTASPRGGLRSADVAGGCVHKRFSIIRSAVHISRSYDGAPHCVTMRSTAHAPRSRLRLGGGIPKFPTCALVRAPRGLSQRHRCSLGHSLIGCGVQSGRECVCRWAGLGILLYH